MTEKNIFVYKLCLLLNISDFSFFYVKTATFPEKVTSLFPRNPPPLKVKTTSSLPF